MNRGKRATSGWTPAGDLSRWQFLSGVGTVGVVAAGGSHLAACGSGDNSGAGPGKGEQLKMGMVLPLTGLLSTSWIPLFSNAQVATDEINAAGGILGHKISIEKEDDQGSPAKEPQAMQKLIGGGVNFVIGPSGSTQTLASLAVSTKAKVLQGPWGNDYAVGDGSQYPYCYQCTYNTVQEGELFGRYLVENAGLKKIGILQENTAFGVAGTKASLDALKKLGVEPVSTQVYAIDQTDLSGYVGNLKQAGAEGVIAWIANLANSTAAFRAMAALNWQPAVAGHSGVAFKGLFDFLPPEALQKIYSIQYKNFTWSRAPDRTRNIVPCQEPWSTASC